MSTKTDFDADEKRLLDSADRILGGAGEMLNRIDLGPTGIAWVMAVQLLAERFKHAVRRQKKAMGEEAEPIRKQFRRRVREWAKRTRALKGRTAQMEQSASYWIEVAIHRVAMLSNAIDAAERHLILEDKP